MAALYRTRTAYTRHRCEHVVLPK